MCLVLGGKLVITLGRDSHYAWTALQGSPGEPVRRAVGKAICYPDAFWGGGSGPLGQTFLGAVPGL